MIGQTSYGVGKGFRHRRAAGGDGFDYTVVKPAILAKMILPRRAQRRWLRPDR
jgi:hypothetical protein